MASFFDTKIEFLRGVGSQRGELLNKELNIFTYAELLQYFPFRYEDRTAFLTISQLTDSLDAAQIKGRLKYWEKVGDGPKTRLIGYFTDHTGTMELTWFQSVAYWEKNLKRDMEYVVYGKPTQFQGRFSILHPEMELLTPENVVSGGF
jgi:ATP-dependent DNA helicase RecG